MMSLRSIPPEMDADRVAQIDRLLDHVAGEHGVFLPLAVESGSRAWGFPSPDSDYDCRFIFVRRVAQHLTASKQRFAVRRAQVCEDGWIRGSSPRMTAVAWKSLYVLHSQHHLAGSDPATVPP
jgi:hypothetical protein